jgi:hypothetical protein
VSWSRKVARDRSYSQKVDSLGRRSEALVRNSVKTAVSVAVCKEVQDAVEDAPRISTGLSAEDVARAALGYVPLRKYHDLVYPFASLILKRAEREPMSAHGLCKDYVLIAATCPSEISRQMTADWNREMRWAHVSEDKEM